MNSISDIINIHKSLYPNIILDEQNNRYKLAYKKYIELPEIINNFVDLYIEAIGLFRFGLILPLINIQEIVRIINFNYFMSDKTLTRDSIEQLIITRIEQLRKEKQNDK